MPKKCRPSLADLILASFLLVGVTGWAVESIMHNRWHCDDLPYGIRQCLPISVMWGSGGVILLMLRLVLPNAKPLHLAIISGVLLSVLECVAGSLARRNGNQPWNYKRLAFCHGFASIPVTLAWIAGSFVFFTLIDKLNSKLDAQCPSSLKVD